MRVMLAYDGSAGAEAARDLLAGLPLPDGSAITVVAALEKPVDLVGAPEGSPLPHPAVEAEEYLQAELQQMLLTAAAPLRTRRWTVETRIVRGRPASALVDEAHSLQPDLLAIGSRGHGPLATVLLGSVSTELVDHAPCPVLVARHPSVRRIVIAVDGSQSSGRAVATLCAWPIFAGLPARIVAVAQSPSWAGSTAAGFYPTWGDLPEVRIDERREQLVEVASRAADWLLGVGLATTVELRDGDPAEQVIAAATEDGADLIVVGSRGLSALPRLILGSVARKVLLHAPQSVLVVREARQRVYRTEPERVPAALVGIPA